MKKNFFEKFFDIELLISKTKIRVKNRCIANLKTGEKLNQNKKPKNKKIYSPNLSFKINL